MLLELSSRNTRSTGPRWQPGVMGLSPLGGRADGECLSGLRVQPGSSCIHDSLHGSTMVSVCQSWVGHGFTMLSIGWGPSLGWSLTLQMWSSLGHRPWKGQEMSSGWG